MNPLYLFYTLQCMGRDGSVGIATRYRLDGPGIESQWGEGRDFPHLSGPVLRHTQPPVQSISGLSREQSDRGVALTTNPHLAPRLKEEYSYTSTQSLGLRGLL